MIPPYTKVSTATELTEMWRELVGSGGFAQSTLWVVFFDEDDRVEPLLMPIDDIPPDPDAEMHRSFGLMVRGVLAEPGPASVAFLLSRPGPAVIGPQDRAWGRFLTSLPDERTRRWPVHLATRDRVRVLAPDDLMGVA